jgi:hypothetical protein
LCTDNESVARILLDTLDAEPICSSEANGIMLVVGRPANPTDLVSILIDTDGKGILNYSYKVVDAMNRGCLAGMQRLGPPAGPSWHEHYEWREVMVDRGKWLPSLDRRHIVVDAVKLNCDIDHNLLNIEVRVVRDDGKELDEGDAVRCEVRL